MVGDEIVLSDCVCRACNNALSILDATLLDFEPIAILRTVHGPMTKKGRFPPRARFRELDVEKVAPRGIRVTEKTGRRATTREELPDGTVRLSMQVTGRRRFDPVPLARAVFRIGLGLVAHDAGPDAALAPRYDRARDFVRGQGSMPNHLLMLTTSTPHESVTTWWRPTDGSTVVAIDIFGVAFAIELDAVPFGLSPEAPRDHIADYWLGEEEP